MQNASRKSPAGSDGGGKDEPRTVLGSSGNNTNSNTNNSSRNSSGNSSSNSGVRNQSIKSVFLVHRI
jgi:hypothetical protein